MKPLFSLTMITLLFTYNAHAKKEFNFEARKASCQSKSSGDVCSFEGKKGKREGTCKEGRKDKSVLLCVGGKKGKGGMFKELNLTKEQYSKLKEYKETKKKNREEMKALKGKVKALKEEVKQGFLKNISDEKLLAIHKEITEVRAKLESLRFSKMITMKNILNEEQRKKFIEHESKRKDKFKKKRKERSKKK